MFRFSICLCAVHEGRQDLFSSCHFQPFSSKSFLVFSPGFFSSTSTTMHFSDIAILMLNMLKTLQTATLKHQLLPSFTVNKHLPLVFCSITSLNTSAGSLWFLLFSFSLQKPLDFHITSAKWCKNLLHFNPFTKSTSQNLTTVLCQKYTYEVYKTQNKILRVLQ